MPKFFAFLFAVAAFFGLVGTANAAVDAAVTSGLTTAAVDAGTVGAAVLLVILAIATFKWIRRAL